MTIVAGFKCEGGIVLCADTQETAQDLKLWVEKLNSYEQAWCQAAFGGSGHGDMLEMLIQRIKSKLDKGYDNIAEVSDCIRQALREGYEQEINLHPDPANEKIVTLLLAVRPRAEKTVTLFKSTGPVLHEIDKYEIIGVGEIVNYVAKNLYRDRLPIGQGVVLGTHLVSLAKMYVESVGGNTHILVLTDSGQVQKVRLDETEISESFFEQCNKLLGELFLSYADTALHELEFADRVSNLAQQVILLRHKYLCMLQQRVMSIIETDPNFKDAYQKLPEGTRTVFGNIAWRYRFTDDSGGYAEPSPAAPGDDPPFE